MTSGSENEDNSDTVSMAGDVSEYADVPTMADYRTAPLVLKGERYKRTARKSAVVACTDKAGKLHYAEVEGFDYDSETSALDVTPWNTKMKGKPQSSESKKTEAMKKLAKVQPTTKQPPKRTAPKTKHKGKRPKRYDGLPVDVVQQLFRNVSQENSKYVAEYIRSGMDYLPEFHKISSYVAAVKKCSPRDFYTAETFVGDLSHVKDLLYHVAARSGLNQMVIAGIGVIDLLTSSGNDLFCNADGTGITKYIQLLMCK